MNTFRLALIFTALATVVCSAAQLEVTGPAGSAKFGEKVLALSTGNILVIDSGFDDGAVADVGAIYLYSPTGTIISTLKGSTAGDQIGNGAVITDLGNGNVVVLSTLWDNTGAVDAGAVTFINGTTGVNGVLSAANSVVGTKAQDLTSNTIITLLPGTGGNYLIRARDWDNGSALNVGAVRLCNGLTGEVGALSAANSLIGTTAQDVVGVTVNLLNNGAYVVISNLWDNGGVINAGAATFGNGFTPVTGAVSASNSLVGASNNDGNTMLISTLTNGNYLVRWINFTSAGQANAGAVTLCNGTTGLPVGAVTSANSFVGAKAGDAIGTTAVALSNGNYVVGSAQCDNGAIVDAGAVALGNGVTGLTGVVSTSNALMGGAANDSVGSILAVLTNGNYVINSFSWHNGGLAVGAVTWCSGTVPATGLVTPANSLIGSTLDDFSATFIVTLNNGNYVVASPTWNNGAVTDAGSVMLCDGTTGTVGTITPSTALVGTHASDGDAMSILAVNNRKNYVAVWPSWDNNGVTNSGAAVFCSGSTARPVGPVSTANALFGTASGDFIGIGTTSLSNGNYVIRAPAWDNGAVVNAGMACWCNGSAGRVGAISALNALVGSQTSDAVGSAIAELKNGNVVTQTKFWANGGNTNAGAATWMSGTRGLTGVVSPANSLVGTQANDTVSIDGVATLSNGDYFVRSGDWANGSVATAGAITFCNGTTGTSGPVTAANSLVGSTAADQFGFQGSYTLTADDQLLARAQNWDNGALANASAVVLLSPPTPAVGPITTSNGVLGNVATPVPTLTTSYNATSRLLVVGKGAENKIVISGSGAGKVAFEAPLITVTEGGIAPLVVKRTGGTEGTVTVNLSTTTAGSTATAGTDYTAISSQLLTFAPGVSSQTISLTTLVNAPTNEPNELIKVVLSGGTASLGTQTTMLVRIVDTDDTTVPGAPVITSPASNARVGVDPGDTITITGTAADNRGISLVEVRLNGGTFAPATLTNNTGTSATWSIKLAPQSGANLIEVRSSDTKPGTANVSAIVSRSFVVTRPLEVRSLGATGTFTSGFAPRSFRESGKLLTLTATAPSGFLFNKWIINGGSNAVAGEIGLTAAQLELPTISFIFRESLSLTAEFKPNPFATTPAIVGTYHAFVRPSATLPDRAPIGSSGVEDGTAVSTSTEGLLILTISSNASFTGKLSMDGLSFTVSGSFDGNGEARFGTKRDRVLFLNRSGKEPLRIALVHSLLLPILGGSVSDSDHFSSISGERRQYSSTTLVPANLLGPANANQLYNIAFLKFGGGQPNGITNDRFPQGFGFGTITLTKTGSVTFSGQLPDGTAFTASGGLSNTNICFFFTPLYGKRGLVLGDFSFDTSPPDTDVTVSQLDWIRPPLDDQYYPSGWPESVLFVGTGTKVALTPGSSFLPGLPVIDADGNADLHFADGLLPGEIVKKVGITATDAIQKPLPVDSSFTLSIGHTTGKFSGTFTHPLGITGYQGIILQKGTNRQGLGFFKSKAPSVKDYLGQAGGVVIGRQ